MERMLADIPGALGGDRREASAPENRAQRLIYDAWETADGAQRRALAHEALALWPDCADAYVLLAGEEDGLEAKRTLYEQGVAAGERALGPDTFAEDAGHFWSLLETRPYMRAREGLARCLWALGRREEAVAHFQDLLRLNPGDNQGVRFALAGQLVELGQDEALARLLSAYAEDAAANQAYTRALLAFRQDGPSDRANALLDAARKRNPHVPALLLGHKRMPQHLTTMFNFGDESEAAAYVAEGRAAWERSAGALDWLAQRWISGVDVRALLLREETAQLSERTRRKALQFGEALVPALVDVLKDKELLWVDSPGKGWAPIHAARLLGALKTESAVPAMVEVLGTLEPDVILFSELIHVLVQYGPSVAPATLEALEGGRVEKEMGLLEVLAKCGARSEAIFTRLARVLRERPLLGAVFLADYGDPAALPLLQESFDAYDPGESEEFLFGETLLELKNAIHRLGGTLSDEQQKKYDTIKGHRKRLFTLLPPPSVPTRRKERPERNAPCWCGSGMKYKKCHLPEDEGRAK